MEILYVSSVPSPSQFDEIKTHVRPGAQITTYGMNESGYKFHTLIMNGLCQDKNVNVTSLVGRSVSRKTHKGLFWKKVVEKPKENLVYNHLEFINLPILKHLCIGIALFFKTLFWIFKNRKKEKGIIIDASYVTALPFVLAAAFFSSCKTTAIFCDIYEYMADVKDARDTKKVSFLRRIARRIAQFCYRRLSSYVFLTEQMNPLLNPKGKPYIVMEGLVDSTLENASNELADKAGRKIVMYAGALREAYGLKNLVEGFRAYKNDEAQLWIFGDGDYRDEIQRNAEQDPRIKFGGAIHLSEVVKKEHQVSLLINPRPVEKEFTQYSFPSKNMEYMVSGTPILTTRLPGMPQEYSEYVYTIDGDTAADITVALEEVFSHSEKELHEKGKKAKEFVLTRKNNIIQSKRIMELLSERSSQ